MDNISIKAHDKLLVLLYPIWLEIARLTLPADRQPVRAFPYSSLFLTVAGAA
ncbi:hypothetical protein STRDD11_01630 [Streptococcus sp. DD11]|nr:hypothetical protein STRDD11_01630 [Streptococcus sp. DD11]